MSAPVQRLRQEITIEYGEVLQATVDAADLAAVLDAAEALAMFENGHKPGCEWFGSAGCLCDCGAWVAFARWRELTGETTP